MALSGNSTLRVADAETFARLVSPDSRPQRLATDLKFTEGPVWMSQEGGYLLFSDIPADTIYRWSEGGGLKVFRQPSHNANGNTRDRQGRLITCEHGSRRVTRTEKDGSITVLAERYNGKRLNSPNDVVVKSDDSIWFTDPPYGLPRQTEGKELDRQYVFRLDPRSGKLSVVAEDFDRPNGLCFSPDEKRLYIADSAPNARHVRVFDVRDDGTLANGRVLVAFAKDEGVPDGMRCDSAGRLWSSARDGVHVYAPDGGLIGKVPLPETCANLCFGGPDGRTLYMTASKSLYCLRLNFDATGRSGNTTKSVVAPAP
mgnify:CR=1 FL=1